MTYPEFQDWFRSHASHFTGLAAWLSKLPEKSTSALTPGREDILHAWFAVLRDVDLAPAKEATAEMFRGAEETPKNFDAHPAAIRRIAHAGREPERRHYAHTQDTYRCLDCLDTGVVLCWHPETVAAVKKSGEFTQPLYRTAVPCQCAEGSRWMYKRARKPARYSPARYAKQEPFPVLSDERTQAALREWLRTRVQHAPGYEQTFAQFGG